MIKALIFFSIGLALGVYEAEYLRDKLSSLKDSIRSRFIDE